MSGVASLANRVALVTGGNKGIGYAICSSLASQPNLTVLLCSRDVERGQQAVSALAKQGKTVNFLQLDVTNRDSVAQAAKHVKDTYGGLDILMNNAGMVYKGTGDDKTNVETTFATNFYGLLDMCHAFFPLMNQNGRVVHVASTVGKMALNTMNQTWRDKLMDDKLTEKELISLMSTFASDVTSGQDTANGWPPRQPNLSYLTYRMSKAGVMALTRIQARSIPSSQFVINAVCPGWVKTDVGGPNAALTVEEGAQNPVWAALLPVSDSTPHGAFLANKAVQSYHD